MKLYELSTNYTQLVNMFEEAEEESQLESIFDTLTAIADEVESKADSIAKIMKQMELEQEMIEKEVNRLGQRVEKLKKNRKMLKAYLQEAMIATQKEKFKTDLFNFTIRNNAPSVEITNELEIPSEFIITTIDQRIDRVLLLKALKDKQVISGATLKQSKSLVIK